MNSPPQAQPEKDMFGIGVLSARSGVPASAIRYYEQIRVLPTPKRVNGRRTYSVTAIASVLAVRFAREAGFTLRDIKTLLSPQADAEPLSLRWRDFATSKISEIDKNIERLTTFRELLRGGLECNCFSLNDCDLFRTHSEASNDTY